MKIITFPKNKKIRLAIVCCLHGDEEFGLVVFRYLANKKIQGVKIILAHEQAIRKDVRYIKSDLNRSFPGRLGGNLESRLAQKILNEVKNVPLLIDVHTTTSAIKMTPIITRLNESTQQIVNLCSSREVAYMRGRLGKTSLINQVNGGVSLEFNERYAKRKGALREFNEIVQFISNQSGATKRDRKIFYFSQTIPKAIRLDKNAKNFRYMPLLGIYPFLLKEKSYVTHQGFSA